MAEKVKRKRGAPKGNQNARKHGFYAKVLDEAERLDFELAAINSGRLKVYDRDASDESREFWKELERAKVPLPPVKDPKFLCQPLGGARRLPDKPGAAGGSGGKV